MMSAPQNNFAERLKRIEDRQVQRRPDLEDDLDQAGFNADLADPDFAGDAPESEAIDADMALAAGQSEPLFGPVRMMLIILVLVCMAGVGGLYVVDTLGGDTAETVAATVD